MSSARPAELGLASLAPTTIAFFANPGDKMEPAPWMLVACESAG